MQASLNTTIAARTGAQQGYDILTAFEILRPSVIHLSDCSHTANSENLVPDDGDHGAELRELLQEIRHSAVTVVLDIRPRPNASAAIQRTLAFIDARSSIQAQWAPFDRHSV